MSEPDEPPVASPVAPPAAFRLRDPAHRVSTRAPLVWRVTSLAELVAGALVLVVVSLVWFPVPWWVWVPLLVLDLAYVVVMPVLRFRVHRWEANETAVYTQSGWLSRDRRLAPISRVQTVELDQGPVARLVGLATVTVHTASASGPLKVEDLDLAVAEQLVEELTRRTAADPGDAT